MSVISTLTLAGLSHTDGITAANHTFAKESNVVNGIALRDTAQADYSLAPRLVMTAKRPTGASKIIRTKATVTIPYKDTVTGLVAGTITRVIEDIVPVAAPVNVRKDAAKTLDSLAINATYKAVMNDLDFAS